MRPKQMLSGLCAALLALPALAATPAEQFMQQLASLCGQAFEGKLVEGNPSDARFRSETLTMQVRECSAQEIRVPFHVGTDRSRTWVFTPTASGLRLKHDHRHEDGSEDKLTQYGGESVEAGTATLQSFPADAHTKALIPAAADNIWRVELIPGQRFSYQLQREQRRFRVDFDLSRPVAAPPAPWGAKS